MGISSEKLLSPSQISGIKKNLEKIFSSEANNQLTIDLQKFLNQINRILKHLEQSTEIVTHTSGKNAGKVKGLSIVKSRSLSQRYLAEGYLLIFKFREFLLEQTIDYRYYYSDNMGSHVTAFTEDEILKYIKFGTIAIQLNPGALKLKNPALNNPYEILMNKYYGVFTQGGYMRQGKNTSARLVVNPTFAKYVGQNPKLINQRRPNSRQLFNAGHIYEAIDTAISAYLQLQKTKLDDKSLPGSAEKQLLASYIFGKYLMYDSKIASQGPDNTISKTSIKSNDADLYDYRTIIKQLRDIQTICKGGLKSPMEIQKKITELFLNKNDFNCEEQMQKTAQLAFQKLTTILNNQLKNKT